MLRVWHSLPGLRGHVKGLLEVSTARQPDLLPNPINHVCCDSPRPLPLLSFSPAGDQFLVCITVTASELSLSSWLVSS